MMDDPKISMEWKKQMFPKTIDNLPSSYIQLISNKDAFGSLISLIGKILAGF
jgi:hypothetical protein